MSKPWHHVVTEQELTFWVRWLNDIGDDRIRMIDRAECNSLDEVEDFGLSALPRTEQARIMRAFELNLNGRATLDKHAPGSYSLKHDAENWIRLTEGRPYYVSELQCRTCMHILGYHRTWGKCNRYNVSMLSYHRWRRKIDELRRTR